MFCQTVKYQKTAGVRGREKHRRQKNRTILMTSTTNEITQSTSVCLWESSMLTLLQCFSACYGHIRPLTAKQRQQNCTSMHYRWDELSEIFLLVSTSSFITYCNDSSSEWVRERTDLAAKCSLADAALVRSNWLTVSVNKQTVL